MIFSIYFWKASKNRRKWVKIKNDGELWGQIYYKTTCSEAKSEGFKNGARNTLK